MALSEADVTSALQNLPGWAYDDGAITKTYALPSYAAGLAFASAVGIVAEGLNHHPDMTIGYKKVTVLFTTHDDGNVVTDKDIEAATRIEALQFPRE
ncbi:MAG: 4a-hydroxytetrahydrobiopterin dehydratase [Chloroflexota bacterium]